MTEPETVAVEPIDGTPNGAATHYAVLNEGTSSVPVQEKEFPLEKVLISLGAILVPVGVGLIILAWYGVAHTTYSFEQNSYIVSGGLLGLGLIFSGGFSYFGYWLTRQIRMSSRTHSETMLMLDRLQRDSAAAAASMATVVHLFESYLSRDSSSADPPGTNGRRRRMARSSGNHVANASLVLPGVVATKRGTLVHRTDCPVVTDKRDLRRIRADEPGFRACQICRPFTDR